LHPLCGPRFAAMFCLSVPLTLVLSLLTMPLTIIPALVLACRAGRCAEFSLLFWPCVLLWKAWRDTIEEDPMDVIS
jgi:hypothetical protein